MLSKKTIDVFKIGHHTNISRSTGCTVILCPDKTIGGISIQGGASCTRETDLLSSLNLRSEVNSLLLTGGSAFGLAASEGVTRFIKERYDNKIIPKVPTLSLFDLRLGKAEPPTPEEGYEACRNALENNLISGNIGAGTGATIGKIRGIKWAMKGGLGHSNFNFSDGVFINALAVVNAFGDIINDKSGKIIAGARSRPGFLDTIKHINEKETAYLDDRENTTLGVVLTNAKLGKAEINKVAQMAQAGIARVVSPCWTVNDGDIVVALASGEKEYDFNLLGIVAAELVKNAIINAIVAAESVHGIISYSDYIKEQNF